MNILLEGFTMYDITMDLTGDWIRTVKEIVQSAGESLEGEHSEKELALRYFQLTMSAEEAEAAANAALLRLQELEIIIRNNLEATILPDIRKRTSYEGNAFHFCWVYNQGEHIVELKSEYRIPLNVE